MSSYQSVTGPPVAHPRRLPGAGEHALLRYGYALAAVLDLVATGWRIEPLEWLTKPLLTVLLAALVLRAARPVPRPLLAGLGFACLGDVLLMASGTAAFLAGMAAFLGMQVCYLVAFRRAGARPGWPALAGYALFWAAVNALLWPQLGGLALPILGYSLALTAMAATATALGRRVGGGALLFLVSDLMIGAGAADIHLPGGDVLVMASYAAAQYLIVTGYLRRTTDPTDSRRPPQSGASTATGR